MDAEFLFIGSNPAELAAAAIFARHGREVLVLEPSAEIGGLAGEVKINGFHFPRLHIASPGFEPDLPVGLLLNDLGLSAPVLEMPDEVCLNSGDRSFALDDLEVQAEEFDATFGPGFAAFLLLARETWLPAWQGVLSGKPLSPDPMARDVFEGSAKARDILDGMARCLAGAGLDDLSLPLASLALESLWRPLFLPAGGIPTLMKKLAAAIEFDGSRVLLNQNIQAVTSEADSGFVHTDQGAFRASRIVKFAGTVQPNPIVTLHYAAFTDTLDPDERLYHFIPHPRAGIVLLQNLPAEDNGVRLLILCQPLPAQRLSRQEFLDLIQGVFPQIQADNALAYGVQTLTPKEFPSYTRLPWNLPLAVEQGRRAAMDILNGIS